MLLKKLKTMAALLLLSAATLTTAMLAWGQTGPSSTGDKGNCVEKQAAQTEKQAVAQAQPKNDPNKGPRIVGEIIKVKLAQQDVQPPNLIVTVVGKVNTAGYTKPRLVRAVYAMPPDDGIQDYFLLAVPPDGVAAQVVSEVTAFDNWKGFTKEAPWLKGIRIHGVGGGVMVSMFAK